MKPMFDYSKSMGGKSGKPEPKGTRPAANTSSGTGSGKPMFSFPSMKPVMDAREVTEQTRVNSILNPDTSKRLRFPSMGDPPRPEPKRSDFQDKTGLSFPSMGPDSRTEKRFQAAHAAWKLEQEHEGTVLTKILRTQGQ